MEGGAVDGYGYGLAAIGGKTEADGSNAGGDEERAVEAGAAGQAVTTLKAMEFTLRNRERAGEAQAVSEGRARRCFGG